MKYAVMFVMFFDGKEEWSRSLSIPGEFDSIEAANQEINSCSDTPDAYRVVPLESKIEASAHPMKEFNYVSVGPEYHTQSIMLPASFSLSESDKWKIRDVSYIMLDLAKSCKGDKQSIAFFVSIWRLMYDINKQLEDSSNV